MSEVVLVSEQYPDIYQTGLVDLGAMNPSALKKLAIIATNIVRNKEPYPPSLFAKFVADLITNEDKQDYSMIISGPKGAGKSYSTLYIAIRIAQEIALIRGGIWQDYFSLDNCSLLEDSDGINKILKHAKKFNVVVIDDAGVAIGSRDFATTQNKNFNKLLSTCRTMRWCLILNVPMRSHIDKQVRELVNATATVYKSFHKAGFNILKMGSVKVLQSFKDKPIYPRYSFNNRKVDFWVAFSPDKDLAEEYDRRRDAASQKLIAESITGEEEKKLLPREIKWKRIVEEHYETIKNMKGKRSIKSMMRETGLTESNVNKLIAMVMKEERDDGRSAE